MLSLLFILPPKVVDSNASCYDANNVIAHPLLGVASSPGDLHVCLV